MLAPVLEPAYRAADMPRRERDQEVLGIELAASTKAAAHIVFDQVDLGCQGRDKSSAQRGAPNVPFVTRAR